MSARTIEAPARLSHVDDLPRDETTPRSRRRKVLHWFLEDELEEAQRVGGLVLIALCGRAEVCGRRGGHRRIPVVGELMAVTEPEDCKSCAKAYESYLRRKEQRLNRWERLNGWQ